MVKTQKWRSGAGEHLPRRHGVHVSLFRFTPRPSAPERHLFVLPVALAGLATTSATRLERPKEVRPGLTRALSERLWSKLSLQTAPEGTAMVALRHSVSLRTHRVVSQSQRTASRTTA